MRLLSRRRFIQAGLGSTATIGIPRAVWAKERRPSLGAIRWDAWYDPNDGNIARAMETALGPNRYHDRMPFFGTETGRDSIRVNGNFQSVMDREISLAFHAGLNYWAFVGYDVGSPMTNALNLYLASKLRNRIEFCMIGSIANGSSRGYFSERVSHEVAMMAEEGYVKVLDNRPLYFILSTSEKQIKNEWGGYQGVVELLTYIRISAQERGMHNPYIVLLGSNPATAMALGCDAIGDYAISMNHKRSPYKKLTLEAEVRWNQLAASHIAMIPTAMTGWDQRPLIEHPPSWDSSYLEAGVGLDKYYERATPKEIADHLLEAISWTESHRAVSPANTVLVYAWNECGEGFGALVPTYLPGTPLGNESRLNAIRGILGK